MAATPYTLYPVPCTLYPTPCTLYPVPCTLHPAPCTLYPTPCTLHPVPCTLYPVPCTLKPCTLHLYPVPCTRQLSAMDATNRHQLLPTCPQLLLTALYPPPTPPPSLPPSPAGNTAGLYGGALHVRNITSSLGVVVSGCHFTRNLCSAELQEQVRAGRDGHTCSGCVVGVCVGGEGGMPIIVC